MVVCTFLESYDLSKHVIVPFFTYGATTYLNESMQKIYKCTPNSVHIPATLPEDLDPEDITRPGRPDDAGIEMPGNANGVERWLSRLGIAGIEDTAYDPSGNVRIYTESGTVRIELPEEMNPNTVEIYDMAGTLVRRMSDELEYSVSVPAGSVYLLSMVSEAGNIRINRKLVSE